MIKPMGSQEMRVMGAMDEEDDYEEGIPEMDESTLIRSKVKTEELEADLRRKALAKILDKVGQNLDHA